MKKVNIHANAIDMLKRMSNEDQLKAMPKNELAQTIHAFSLGFAPWCDYHCKNRGDDGCDQCIQAWLDRPAEETEVPLLKVPINGDLTTCKHLSEVKQGDTILLMGRHYVTLHDAHQDMAHPRNEWHVEASYQEGNTVLYECLYENSFLDGMATIVIGKA